MNYLTFAWRNLWRNRRRTLITVASIFFGVLFSTLMNSMQNGTYQNMIDMMVKLSTGYLQVQDPEFKENRSINNAFEPDKEILQQIRDLNHVTTVSRRIETFALFSSGPNTRGGAVIGFEPATDSKTSNLANWISEGSFIMPGDNGVLVTSNIADHLDMAVNDTIILISQGYRGVTAAGLYPVRGILTFNTPQMNSIGVFMDVDEAANLFQTQGKVTSLMIMLDNYHHVARTQQRINELTDSLVVEDWASLNPELVNFIESDRAGGVLMIGILYLIIGFGILGTIIMMVAERRREMAVMVAVGMKKYRLALVLFIETVLIGIIGVLAGFAGSLPVIFSLVSNPLPLPDNMAQAYLQYGFEPYLFFSADPKVFINQILVIFVITLFISLYPLLKVKNMIVSRSIRS
jgi:putative ABC transport system permease protein